MRRLPRSVDEREEETYDVVTEAIDPPITTVQALAQRCQARLSAQIWSTCCWADEMGRGWKIGDFNFLVVDVDPENSDGRYIQFWSEPGEAVEMEVSSGEWCPGALKYLTPAKRQLLATRGFAIGGTAANFTKEVVVDCAAAAEKAALETLEILFEVFDYRGERPLGSHRYCGARARQDAVHGSATAYDVAKLARYAGFRVCVNGERSVTLRRGNRTSVVTLGRKVRGAELFRSVTFQSRFASPVCAIDVVERLRAASSLFLNVFAEGDDVVAEMSLSLDGGVTAQWIANSLRMWSVECRRLGHQLNRLRSRRAPTTRVPVH